MAEKTQAELRKEVYEYLRGEGFDLTEKQAAKLKSLMAPVKERTVDIVNNTPREHSVLCPKCGGKQLHHGKKWKQDYNRTNFHQKEKTS